MEKQVCQLSTIRWIIELSVTPDGTKIRLKYQVVVAVLLTELTIHPKVVAVQILHQECVAIL